MIFLANTLYVVVRLSVVCTFVRRTQTIEIFGNRFTPFDGTLAICDLCVKILRRLSQGNAFVGGLNPRGVGKYSDCVKVVEDRPIHSAAEM